MKMSGIVAVSVAVLAMGCGGREVAVNTADADGTGLSDASRPDGAALYARYCGFCHGPNGEGYLADNANALANQRFLEAATDSFLKLATIHGRPGTPMSAWGEERGGPLSSADVDAVVAHIRSWQKGQSVDLQAYETAGIATRGAPIYNVMCASCHGPAGEGVTAVSLNNPWFHATASDGFIRHAIVHGRPGTAMPGYAAQLNERQVDDVVAAIRAWKTPVDAAPETPYVPDVPNAAINPTGESADFTLRESRFVPADDVKAAIDAGRKVILLDARPVADYLLSHMTGAVGLPFYDLEKHLADLPKDVWIIAYCGCPHAVSGQAVDALRAAGFAKTAVLDEGFYVWESRGYPVTRR